MNEPFTREHLCSTFNKGDLIRIKKTGEVFIFESSTGGANFRCYLVVNVHGVLIEYRKSLRIDDVEKVSKGNKQ